MNRIQITPLASLNYSQSKLTDAQTAEPNSDYSKTRQHQIFIPLNFEKAYAYPLIVWLHSAGDDAQQLLRIMPSISLRNYCAVAPQGPSGAFHSGYFWPQQSHEIERAHQLVDDAIAQVRSKFKIASDRIFLAGYGSGGTMAFRIAMKMANQVAGIASFNGPLPQGFNPLGELKRCRRIPVLWAHCQKSLEFSEKQLCQQLKLLHIGGFNVTVRQYPFADELPALALKDLDRWIINSFDSAIA